MSGFVVLCIVSSSVPAKVIVCEETFSEMTCFLSDGCKTPNWFSQLILTSLLLLDVTVAVVTVMHMHVLLAFSAICVSGFWLMLYWNVCSQVVRSATSGSGSSVCGVAPDSYGSKELHYVLRTLSSAACHNHVVFTEVAKSILRVNLVTLPKRGECCCITSFSVSIDLGFDMYLQLQMGWLYATHWMTFVFFLLA